MIGAGQNPEMQKPPEEVAFAEETAVGERNLVRKLAQQLPRIDMINGFLCAVNR